MGNHTRLEEAKQDKFKKKIEEAINEIILPLKKENEELKTKLTEIERKMDNIHVSSEMLGIRVDKMDKYQDFMGAQLNENVRDLNAKIISLKPNTTSKEKTNGPD